MKGINYGRFISVYQSQDGGMYYNTPFPHNVLSIVTVFYFLLRRFGVHDYFSEVVVHD